MKLLVVSHACVLPINQRFYTEVERQTGWQLAIITPEQWRTDYGQRVKADRWPDLRAEMVRIPVWGAGRIPLHTYRTWWVDHLRQIQPDIIYVHHEPYAVATAQVYLANRLSIRRPIGFFTWQNLAKSYPFPFGMTEAWVLRQSAFAFVGSQSAEQVLRDKGYGGNVELLPGSIDPQIYQPQIGSELRTTLIGEATVLIGYLGRLVEEKGVQTLLKSLAMLVELSWHLVIVGSGSYATEIEGLIEQLGLQQRVSLTGSVPHLQAPNYLAAFDVLVLPSETRPHWQEQFGRVILEALACGTPVIGSDSGEIPNLIQATGGGLVFPEGQPAGLADRLRGLILDPELRLQLAEQGGKVVMTTYSDSSVVQRFCQTIEQVTCG